MKTYENFYLTNFNSYRIKSFCKVAYFPENEADVISFFDTHKEFVLLGSGHNIIFVRDYYYKPFIIFNGNYNAIKLVNDGILEVETGAMMCDVAQFALNFSLTGIEVFWDIPSSLGGAVVMNAGACGDEIKDVLIKVRYLDLKDKNIKEIYKEEISFEYRNSFFQKNTDKIILKAWLQLHKGNQDAIFNKMETIKLQRWKKQPKDFPNAGSVFKRPKGYYVGEIIDELLLKGYTVGGAKISEKHGGFIINYNNAKGQDILDIIAEVKRKVWNKYEIDLEIEQIII
jgi:UDP-N-acetylmuramate dehydrogenase